MISEETFNRYAASPAAFIPDLVIDVDGVARRFGEVMDPWQIKDLKPSFPDSSVATAARTTRTP